MDLKEVRYILAIQQYGSITKAAQSLYITQSALSKFLKRVERQIGATLFSRIGNNLIPTYVGKRYLEYASRIIAIQEDWNRERTDLIEENIGELNIAIPLMRGECMIPDIMEEFKKKYPCVRVNLMEESHSIEKLLLTSKTIDFAIYSDTNPEQEFINEELGKEELVLIMSPDHPLVKFAQTRPGYRYPWIDLKKLDNQPMVLQPPEQTTGKVTTALLKEAGVSPQILLQTRNSRIALNMAAAGTAVCFIPETYAKQSRFETPLLRFSIGTPKCEITLYAIYKKGRYLTKYAKHFLEITKNYMKQYVNSANK